MPTAVVGHAKEPKQGGGLCMGLSMVRRLRTPRYTSIFFLMMTAIVHAGHAQP